MISKRKAEQILGLIGAYTQDDLKDAFRKRIKKAHPDVGGSEEQMKLLNEAREVIEEEFARTGASQLYVEESAPFSSNTYNSNSYSSAQSSYSSAQSAHRAKPTDDVPSGSGTVYERIKREEAEKRREVDERERQKAEEVRQAEEAAQKREATYKASARSGRKVVHWILRLTLVLLLFFLGQVCVFAQVIATGSYIYLIQPGISWIGLLIFVGLALRELIFGTFSYKFYDPDK